MSTVLIIGDGPLAYEMAALIDQRGHTTLNYLYNGLKPERSPLNHLPNFLSEMADRVDVTIEAIIGDRACKREAITLISDAFLGTSEPILTAVLNASATEVGAWAMQPENVVGWAALPPLSSAKVFEVLPSTHTTPEMITAANDFLASLGKDPVLIRDTVGGVLPRIVANLINEAAYALTEQVARAEDIDEAMKLGTNYPHGPLAWGDLIGLDQVAGILTALGEAYGNDKYRAAPLLRQLVLAGHWGKRSAQGFYPYPPS